MFMKKKMIIVILGGFMIIALFLYCRRPIFTGELNKQTVYWFFLNCFHIQDRHAEAQFMLIDDDSGYGIFKIREICERVGVKATFAVVPAFLDSIRCDSLRKWQQEGYGIALHGYNHGRWKDWTKEEICIDIDKSMDYLQSKGFDISRINIVVSPSFYNTRAIRSAISSKGMKMVMGANVVNPDTTIFQWGRMFVKNNTDIDDACKILQNTKENNSFVILGTHSSIKDEFSAKKLEICLRMVITLRYKQYHK